MLIVTTVLCWVSFVIIPSFPAVRKVLSAPLLAHDRQARGDVCYVLAGGASLWERLDAGADLVRMRRVRGIILMQEETGGRYSFRENRTRIRRESVTEYLAWRGIPADSITWIAQAEGPLGTRAEAKAVAERLPKDVKKLVVISSAPHMKRCVLAFRRSLPAGVQVVPYAATSFQDSYELFHPIWLEYLKLFLYLAVP